jgi:hypothetical protein
MEKIDFTKEERTIIADFIHAVSSDTLIKTEAIDLINILHAHDLIEDKSDLVKKVEAQDDGIVSELKTILTTKVSSEQGGAIMDEYYGREPRPNQEESKEKEPKKPQHYNWGVGKEANSKAWRDVKVRGEDYELIHGEFPHSRQDNNTYARSKENPEEIYEFDGHRLPFKIEIEESNYIKRSDLSGNEIRKACKGKLFLNGVQIYECGGRTYEYTFKNIDRFINSMEEQWSWFPNNLNEYLGKLIKYEGQIFKIESFVVSQACMILVTPDGKERQPFASEVEDLENGNFDGVDTLKVEINSPHIWWFLTEKELAQFEVGEKAN